MANKLDFEKLREIRATKPEKIAKALANRKKRPLLRGDNRLFIVAADHPARGALAIGQNQSAMADRYELLERLVISLERPGVDGVLGTPDIIEDLALLGVLDEKIVVGSMNRGGLRGASFEMDDRYTAYDIAGIKNSGLDFAKNLIRINHQDAGTAATLEASAKAINQAAAARIPIMLEPFISKWIDGAIKNDLTPEAVILSIAIASGLGNSSAYSWMKLPVVEDMARVMQATTLPTLLLGGDDGSDQETLFKSWSSALKLPGVKGLTVGRSLLYPQDGNVKAAVDAAAKLVHG